MNFAFTDDQLALASTVREVLATHCPPQAVRDAGRAASTPGLSPGEPTASHHGVGPVPPPRDPEWTPSPTCASSSLSSGGAGTDSSTPHGASAPGARDRVDRLPAWPQLAEIGFFGLLVPVRHEGLGLGLTDAILAFEETGRAALPGPVVETTAVAPALLAARADLPVGAGGASTAGVLDGDDLLSRLAAGELRVSVRLGDQVYAPDADLADLLIVERDGELHAVPSGSVRLTPQSGVDPVRRLFSVTVHPPAGSNESAARLAGDPACAQWLEAAAVPARRRATVAVAAQLVGLARHLLETSSEYAKSRRHFGAATESFQAVKHQLADIAIAIDFAAPLVYAAAMAVDGGYPWRSDAEVGRAVSAAKATAGEAAARAAQVALQVHGAIGYTDELDLRLWLARVWSLGSAYGDTGVHRARLRAAILGTPELRRGP